MINERGNRETERELRLARNKPSYAGFLASLVTILPICHLHKRTCLELGSEGVTGDFSIHIWCQTSRPIPAKERTASFPSSITINNPIESYYYGLLAGVRIWARASESGGEIECAQSGCWPGAGTRNPEPKRQVNPLMEASDHSSTVYRAG